jgi:hypothetical protein
MRDGGGSPWYLKLAGGGRGAARWLPGRQVSRLRVENEALREVMLAMEMQPPAATY